MNDFSYTEKGTVFYLSLQPGKTTPIYINSILHYKIIYKMVSIFTPDEAFSQIDIIKPSTLSSTIRRFVFFLFLKGKNKILPFWINLFLAGLLFLGFGKNVQAQNDGGLQDMKNYCVQYAYPDSETGYTGIDEYGYYINLYVRVRNKGARTSISSGTVYYETQDGSSAPIFTFHARNDNAEAVTVEPKMTGVKLRAFNGNDDNNTWSDYVPAGNTATKYDGGSDLMEGYLKWYVPQSLMQKYFRVKINVTIVANGKDNYYEGYPSANWNAWLFYINPPNYNANFKFSPSSQPGKIVATYSYQNSIGIFGGYRYGLKHYMDDDVSNTINAQPNINPTGSFDVNIKNAAENHYLRTLSTGKDGRLTYLSSQTVQVPAYVWPDVLEATYDNKDSVKLQWNTNINNLGTGFIDNDEFEIQRSTDSTFATNVISVARYPYDAAKATYQTWDNLSDLQGGLRIYYRLRRTKTANDWGWSYARTANSDITINSTQKADTTILSDSSGTPTAIISWQPFRGIWTTGTLFTLKKLNKTTGATSTTDLTEEEARSGRYEDENISYCNEFSYSILIKLGNNYTSPKETKVPGSILAVNIGTIVNLSASKGYFPDRTELQWHSQGGFDSYIIKRRIYGSADNFVQIANIPGSAVSDLQTEDSKGSPGVYYQYMVIGAVKCNNSLKYSKDTLYSIGFRAPTGNIYGRVTYENGQPVENVAVRLQNNDNNLLGQSIYLEGSANASYLKLDSLNTPFEDSAFTLQTWIRPDNAAPANQVIFSRSGQYEMGFNAEGKIYFTYNGQTVTGNYMNASQSFIHITGIHSRDSLILMLNNSVIGALAATYNPAINKARAVFIGSNNGLQNFKGYIDEMSAWNIALSREWVAQNYTRLLTGGEKGLAAYWRFDETITDQFYDISHLNEKYNQNDGTMNAAHVKHSGVIPGSGQLSLKAFTDSTGNYTIEGVPYSGNGTTYTVVPLFGTHQFDPISVNRNVSENSSSFTVDFKDNSAFKVTGIIYYRNSTVPAEGVQFTIDGKFALGSDGRLIETDTRGMFTLSVPVGFHEVRAVKNNHIFENEGKITDRNGENLNYQDAVGPRILYDNTTIRFVGRIAGGALQAAYPLGHSLSSNNLGKTLSLTLKLTNPANQLILPGNDSTVIVNHFLPSNQVDSSKIHHTRVVYSPDKMVIYPDPLTGEFATDLIPEKFNASNAEATGWVDLLEGKQVLLDFTNKFIPQYSLYTYQDSIMSKQGNWSYQDYSDTVYYSDFYQFIKRVTPNFTLTQINKTGKVLDYFGDSLFVSQSLAGKKDSISLIDKTKTGEAFYLFGGHPVFTQGATYTYKLKAFESYPFYESVQPDGTKIIGQKNNKDIVDEVPTRDGSISIYNKIQNGPAIPDTLSLDSSGVAKYQFIAGDPVIIAPGLKSFATSIKFGQATNVNWKWFGTDQMQAFVTGSKQSGTDFVTAGPNKMLMVLRDPPGNHSYSFAEKGSTISSSSTYSGSLNNSNDIKATADFGAKVITWFGFGAGSIIETEVIADAGLGVHFETNYANNSTKEIKTTLTSRFQTSDDPAFVGAPADVFVGYSTNITYGQSNNLLIINRADLLASDDQILDPGLPSPYLIVKRDGLSLGEKFGTLFAYPQQHITEVLIPNLNKIKFNQLHPTSYASQAQEAANFTKTAIYVSKLDAEDPHYGFSNKDVNAFGEKAKNTPFDDGPSYSIYFPAGSQYRTDTILAINQYISQWQEQLKKNEEAKVNSKLLQNYSFHAGNPIDYSETISASESSTNSFNIIISGSVLTKTGVSILGIGVEVETDQSLGTTQGGSFEKSEENEQNIGFQLAANGVGEYISVDVNKTPQGEFAFKTKGGQTECPYEGGSKTKYYMPGTLLDQPTVQMDKPQISVDKAVINGVPSTRQAAFTLVMNNASDAQWSTNYILNYGNTDSIQGALLAVDGLSIANGRNYAINYGQTLTKTLTLSRGPSAMDYNNIPIILHSACQYDPTGYQQIIADTVYISAHFIPSCSDIHIKSPADKWVINTKSPVNQDNKRYLPIIIDQFDVNNKLFNHIELQYKSTSESNWITVMKFYADSAKLKEAQGATQFITNPQGINYSLVMDDGSFNDQEYDVQAVSYCEVGPGNYVTTESNKVSGIKDTYWPRLFGSPQPANGILGISDLVKLNFNETIAAGLLTIADFQVTGIRNGSSGNHSVSVLLDGQNDYMTTEFDKNLSGKDITVEMWILPDNLKNQTVFSQGNINESMELSLTADKYLEVIIGKKTIKSDLPVDYQKDQWAHVALNYNATDSTVSAFYNFVQVINNAPVDRYSGIGHFNFGRSFSRQGNLFGGKMHELRIWTKSLSGTQLQINSLKSLSGAGENLLGYYPMNEGKGNIVYDKAHGSNAKLTGNWSTPPGKAYQFEGEGYIRMNTSTSPVIAAMDYTLELWFKAEAGQKEATLVSNGKGDGSETSKDLFSLGFENGLITFRNNGTMVQTPGNYLDNTWHHLAISVNRTSGTAQIFVDGGLKKYFDVKDIGGIASAYTYLGARAWYDPNDAITVHYDQFFKGEIDEFRLWNTYLNETLINKNNNVRLKGDEIGLMAYYPFEKYYEFQNNQELDSTLSDMKIQEDPKLVIPGALGVNTVATNDKAPIIDRGPVANLLFDYVVNNDALIINLLEPKQSIDKTLITFKVKNVRDQNGNALASPITWTAYIDQNQMKWSDNELNLEKDLYLPMQFESNILNSGGTIQNFRLNNLPAWLTATPSSGTVNPKGNQKITFTVNEGLNVGTYNEIINMVNDNNEAEALTVNLIVKGESPDWTVNPADYKYSMVVYGKIRINNIFSSDKGDILAAFSNGKCVGVAHNTYFAANDFWYTFLTVYGDSLQSKNLEFRIWQAKNGKVYEALPSQNISFVNEGINGTSGAPVIFDASKIQFQNISLKKGWNWISFNLANNNLGNVSAALANALWESGDVIKNNEAGFDQYSKTQNWVGTLSTLNNTSLFMVNTANPQTLSMKGALLNLKETPIVIKGNRWNYIGYLPLVNLKIKEALAGYEASNEDVIKSQTGFSMYDARNGWVGNLTYLKPGEGYMLFRKSNFETPLVYPQITGNLIERKMGGISNLEIPVVSHSAYAGNMTMVAIVEEGFNLLPDDKILAFAGEELRGKAGAIQNPVTLKTTFFLNIAGDKQESLIFKVERNGQIFAQSGTIVTYNLDAEIGTLKNPFMLSFKNAGAIIEEANKVVTISPNPFKNKINIKVKLDGQQSLNLHEIQISIFDITGRLILKRGKEAIKNGSYETTWEGKNADNVDSAGGFYFIQITIDGVPTVYKVIKK